jgi:tetratricopeptide (TPR) repeat protein
MKRNWFFAFVLIALVTGSGIAAQEHQAASGGPKIVQASDQTTYQESLYEEARAYAREGELAKAVESMEKTMLYGFYDWDKLKTDTLLAGLRETEWYRAIGESFDDTAIAICNRALTGEPENEIYYRSRGIFYSNKGEYDKALEDFDRAIAINPAYPNAYNGRGIIYDNKGEYDQAIEDYSHAIALAVCCSL